MTKDQMTSLIDSTMVKVVTRVLTLVIALLLGIVGYVVKEAAVDIRAVRTAAERAIVQITEVRGEIVTLQTRLGYIERDLARVDMDSRDRRWPPSDPRH